MKNWKEYTLNKHIQRRALHFAAVFVLLFVIILLAVMIPFHRDMTVKQHDIELKSMKMIESVQRLISRNYRDVAADMDFLSALYRTAHLGRDRTSALDILGREYGNYLSAKKVYDRIRLLDLEGGEILTIQSNNGKPAMVRRAAGQQILHKRFKELIKNDKGDIFISRFDPAAGKGTARHPGKALVHFMVPVYTADDVREGFLLVSFLGRGIINGISLSKMELLDSAAGKAAFFLLNKDGLLLLNPGKNDPKKDQSFGSDYPTEWYEITRKIRGSINTDKGLFVFSRIDSCKDITAKNIITDDRQWYCVLGWDPAGMNSLQSDVSGKYLILFIILSVVMLGVAFYVSKIDFERRITSEQLMKLEAVDPKTRFLNRGAFLDRFRYEADKAVRSRRTSSLMLCEIDDSAGRDSANTRIDDGLLLVVAEVFRGNLRKQDSLCRWGNGTFAALLPETELKNAVMAAEKMRTIIEGRKFMVGDAEVSVTMSFGLSEFRPGQPIGECTQTAERYLQMSRDKGGNRISCRNIEGRKPVQKNVHSRQSKK